MEMTFKHNQLCTAIVLSIIVLLMSGDAYGGRQDLGAYAARRNVPSQALLNELLANVNEDTVLNELNNYHPPQQQNYLSKWPGLRDLLLASDYEEDNSENNEVLNSRFIDRLHRLATLSAQDSADARTDYYTNDANDNESQHSQTDLTDPLLQNKLKVPVTEAKATFKDHGIKKNVQYMSPCHFKICNMGRKRNARYFY
ncbi:uncharacterized protein LOC119671431 isoform X2 [Teleopsis dalmanni]|uniref:uncharacterized protein LOC119671431 isoform X2 n=1 Tax=Teleopsis dalmanni TaxID=139649 RepID=UPI0018CD762A|nr:uncharacterized protein LOC119671431 isoform X2 [Teleopsis dalmanni]